MFKKFENHILLSTILCFIVTSLSVIVEGAEFASNEAKAEQHLEQILTDAEENLLKIAKVPRSDILHKDILALWKNSKKELCRLGYSPKDLPLLRRTEAMFYASSIGNTPFLDMMLLNSYITLTASLPTLEGKNILHFAAERRDLDSLHICFKRAKRDDILKALKAKDNLGKTPLDYFATSFMTLANTSEDDSETLFLKFERITEILILSQELKLGFPLISDETLAEALNLAAFKGNFTCTDFILKHTSCDVDAPQKNWASAPLHFAVAQRRVEVLQSVLIYSSPEAIYNALNLKDSREQYPQDKLSGASEEVWELYADLCKKARGAYKTLHSKEWLENQCKNRPCKKAHRLGHHINTIRKLRAKNLKK